ncbi:MAG: sigma-54 interaction domain-containing protein [Syntrophales bacterium]
MSIIIKNAFRESLIYFSQETTSSSEIIDRPSLKKLYDDIIERVASTNATILITGESGTGKDVIAYDIYKKWCTDKKFIPVDISCIPETLIESVLFGYEKGAFTGADKKTIGSFELANEGTLFLDEIGNISLDIQAKLLRALQNRAFVRVGGNELIRSNFRLICATNKNLKEEVIKGHFREDLFYRINVVAIHIPPLRDARIDIPVLAKHFLEYFATLYGGKKISYDGEIAKKMNSYDWPGNVRELINITERLVLLYDKGGLDIEEIFNMGSIDVFMSEEKGNIINMLKSTGGDVIESAKRLGCSKMTLYRKIKKHNIDKSRYRS